MEDLNLIRQQAAVYREMAPLLDRLQALSSRRGWPLGRNILQCAVEELERLTSEPSGPEAAGQADRIDRAIAALDDVPDVLIDALTKRQVRAIVDANMRAWVILTEGMHPPSRRRPEEAPAP